LTIGPPKVVTPSIKKSALPAVILLLLVMPPAKIARFSTMMPVWAVEIVPLLTILAEKTASSWSSILTPTLAKILPLLTMPPPAPWPVNSATPDTWIPVAPDTVPLLMTLPAKVETSLMPTPSLPCATILPLLLMTPEKTEPPFISMPKPTAEMVPVLEISPVKLVTLESASAPVAPARILPLLVMPPPKAPTSKMWTAELLAESVPLPAFTTLPEKFATSEMRSA
jgi:hypothetical protein